jgi:hypothetical protein
MTPYMLNIRKLSEEDTTNIVINWLNKCDQVKRLNFNYVQRIREGIEGAAEGYLPISREKLSEESPELFLRISRIIQSQSSS